MTFSLEHSPHRVKKTLTVLQFVLLTKIALAQSIGDKPLDINAPSWKHVGMWRIWMEFKKQYPQWIDTKKLSLYLKNNKINDIYLDWKAEKITIDFIEDNGNKFVKLTSDWWKTILVPATVLDMTIEDSESEKEIISSTPNVEHGSHPDTTQGTPWSNNFWSTVIATVEEAVVKKERKKNPREWWDTGVTKKPFDPSVVFEPGAIRKLEQVRSTSSYIDKHIKWFAWDIAIIETLLKDIKQLENITIWINDNEIYQEIIEDIGIWYKANPWMRSSLPGMVSDYKDLQEMQKQLFIQDKSWRNAINWYAYMWKNVEKKKWWVWWFLNKVWAKILDKEDRPKTKWEVNALLNRLLLKLQNITWKINWSKRAVQKFSSELAAKKYALAKGRRWEKIDWFSTKRDIQEENMILKEQNEQLSDELEEMSDLHEKISSQYEDLRIQYERSVTQVSLLSSQLDGLTSSYDKLSLDIQNIQKENAIEKWKNTDLLEELETFKVSVLALQKEIEWYQSLLDESEWEVEISEDLLDAKVERIVTLNERIEKLENQVLSLKKIIAQNESQDNTSLNNLEKELTKTKDELLRALWKNALLASSLEKQTKKNEFLLKQVNLQKERVSEGWMNIVLQETKLGKNVHETLEKLASSGQFGLPIPLNDKWLIKVTANFYEKRKKWPHGAIDFQAAFWTPYLAMADGIVVKIAHERWWAWYYVRLLHVVTDKNNKDSQIFTSEYFHGDWTFLVKEGEFVTKWQRLMKTGPSGRMNAAHAHVWVRWLVNAFGGKFVFVKTNFLGAIKKAWKTIFKYSNQNR